MSNEVTGQPLALTRALGDFASSLKFDDLPPNVVDHAKACLLDNLGVIIYGTRFPWTQKIVEMIAVEQAKGVSSVFGWSFKTSPSLAVLANASAGHGFELDEIHRDSHLHPGSVVWPVCLAIGEYLGDVSGKQFIAAAVAGYEMGIRVGLGGGHGAFLRGFHPQGTFGTIAAAGAAARLLDLTGEETTHAIGIAGSFSSGLMSAQEGAMVKRLHAGRAAQSGVYGALLASNEFTGIENIIEADFGGLLSTYSTVSHPERILDGLGDRWEILDVSPKLFATAASSQTALDTLRTIMKANSLATTDIDRIEVGCSEAMYQHCAWEYKPKGVAAAQMNLFFGLATMAVTGDVFVDQFSDASLNDPAVLGFMPKIHACVDPEIDAKGPSARHAARVIVHTKSGQRFEILEWHRIGSRDNPAPDDAIEKKFEDLASRRLSASDVARLKELVSDIENLEAVGEIAAIMGGLAKQ